MLGEGLDLKAPCVAWELPGVWEGKASSFPNLELGLSGSSQRVPRGLPTWEATSRERRTKVLSGS